MKILHVIPSLDVLSAGGPAQAVIQLCQELKNQGIEIAIATTITGDYNKSISVPIYYFPRRFNSVLPSEFAFSLPLKDWLKEHVREFDLVHIHFLFTYPSTVACYYANKYKIPYIIEPAGMLNDFCLKKSAFKKRIYMLLFERRNLKDAAAVRFTSEEEMLSAKKINSRENILLPIGLFLDTFKEIEFFKGVFRNRYPQTGNKKIILFFSRLAPKKGLDILIPALEILSKNRNDFVFVISGAGLKGYEKQVKDALKTAGLAQASIFTGFLEGEMKLAVLADSDIFVLSSYDENFGIAVVEAMAAGLPVVISNKVNIYKLIEEYNTGIVKDLNSCQIASALETLINDESLRKEMGGNGKRLVKENFDIKIITKKMIQAYKAYGIQR